MTRTPQDAHIAFIHTLRGVAPLLVLWSHLGGWWLYVAKKDSVIWDFWDSTSRCLRLYQHGGHLGVLLFFLVSGYIITHVSSRETAVEFTIKRIFRLTPTLVAGLGITALLKEISAQFAIYPLLGSESSDWLRGLFFINYVQGTPQPLTVLWTLFIEAIFYTLTLIFLGSSRRNPHGATWSILLATHAINIAATYHPSLQPIMWYVLYIPFLLLGRIFYLTHIQALEKRKALILGLASYISFLVISETVSPGKFFESPREPYLSHIYSALIFLAAYLSNRNRTSRALGFFADISYPLYILHAPAGSLIISLLTKYNVIYEISLAVAVAFVIVLSWLVHRFLEEPIHSVGRRLSARFSSNPKAEPAGPPRS